jgi:hypothetical protein
VEGLEHVAARRELVVLVWFPAAMLGACRVACLVRAHESCRRSTWRCRGEDVDHRLQRLDIDVDEADGIGGRCLRLREHERDRLAREHDLLAGERLETAFGTV